MKQTGTKKYAKAKGRDPSGRSKPKEKRTNSIKYSFQN